MKYVVWLAASGVLVAIALVIFQQIATFLDDRHYPMPGRKVDIGGYELHFLDTGKKGPATVVLDAGMGGTSIGWTLVQERASHFARTVSVDRAGYAWSDASPKKRTSSIIAKELHTLLHKAGIPGPYILVGHSFGGCNMQCFAHLYPTETRGVILVDCPHEDLAPQICSPKRYFNLPFYLALLGYYRLKGPSGYIQAILSPLPESAQKAYLSQLNKARYYSTIYKEEQLLAESFAEVSSIHLGEMPLVVVSAGHPPALPADPADHPGATWGESQKKLLLKSKKAYPLIAENSDHMINHHAPEAITQAIQFLIEKTATLSHNTAQ